MNQKQREGFHQVMEHMRKRPNMYFSSDVPAVVTFLQGFDMAFRLMNAEVNFEVVQKEVILSRGWEYSAQPVWHQMQERGVDNEAIKAEMLAIYSAVWEKIINQQPSVELKSEA